MSWPYLLTAFGAGVLVATLTAPVGVSGAVFLLPIQLSLLRVPTPAVTPTNLLFNVAGGPGALIRYRRTGQVGGRLAGQLLWGTVPGVIVGAVLRVFVVPGPNVFRLIVAGVLLPLGGTLCWRTLAGIRLSSPVAQSDRLLLTTIGAALTGALLGRSWGCPAQR